MVFTGVPVFLDPPNWQQDHPGGGGGSDAIRGGSILTAGGGHGGPLDNEIRSISMLNPPPPQTVPIMVSADSGGTTTSRPTLMADRARLAKLPPPDTNLKCPRCESINTKFCYYNNYSLSQPRYFCKTCRRYWTKGGSLRSVPVGGGCRRNKRNKSGGGNSRSQVMDTSSATSSGGAPALSSTNCTGDMVANHHNHPHLPVLPFLPNIHGFLDYGRDTAGTGFPVAASRDLVFPGGGNSLSLDFMAANDTAEDGNLGQWRMQQHLPAIPFPRTESLVHIEPQLLLPYEGDGSIEAHQYLATAVSQLKTNTSSSNLSQPTDTIRLEEDRSKNLTYMSANGWGDFTNFPSTTNSLL